VLSISNANGLRLRASTAVLALALVDLARARWADALEKLDSLLGGEARAMDPFVGFVLPDKIEAAIRASRLEEAASALPLFEAWIGYSGAPSARSRLAACRALLASGDEATQFFEAALELSADVRPFDLARIRLLYGEHLRRERRRTDARLQLRAALEGFERLRAAPWADRARSELRASGETARKRDPSTTDQLTPQELQVARLVAEGLSNKEVAAQLFLSPRTIDSHLRNVFAKLGITSRTQLARFSLGEEGSAVGGRAYVSTSVGV
jgi:DNA-binding CsgD family transcriptional regulator